MLEVTPFRKNKVDLSQYDHSKDLACRLLMSQFSPEDVEALEEILFSSLTIPLAKLARTLDFSTQDLSQFIEKLSKTGLFKVVKDELLVDKEMRKYFELQLQRFEENFKPDLDFFQGLLKQVPIHVLPNWFAIPRTSNNIFESIVEKYLTTPSMYQRYLFDLNITDSVQRGIMKAVLDSPSLEVDASALILTHQLTQEQFQEQMLFLELSMICCINYRREKGALKAVVTPFYEWGEYLKAIRVSQPTPISNPKAIQRKKSSDFAFVEELSALLALAKKQPLAIERTAEELLSLPEKSFKQLQKECPEVSKADLHTLLSKAIEIELATLESEKLILQEAGRDWLELNSPERALLLYRHCSLNPHREDLPERLQTEKAFRDAEKSLLRLLKSGWIFLDDFLKSVMVPLSETQTIQLRKVGRTWKYQLPVYSEEEVDFLKGVVCEWLFEIGITATGNLEGRDCFCVTTFGRDLFGDE